MTGLGWFHDRPVGRFVLSAVVIVLGACMIGWNLPGESSIRDDIRDRLQPVVYALGIDQGWGVFAPNPSKISMQLQAEVRFADGSLSVYEFPDGDPFIGAYREFRWRKLERRFMTDDSWTSLRRPTATWVGKGMASAEHPVVEVTLVRYKARTPELGSGADHVYEREEIYSRTFDPPLGTPETAGAE